MAANNVWYPGPGEVLDGRFFLQELIGIGPVAATYRCHDQALDRERVLKTIHPLFVRPDLKDVNLFRLFRARGFLHRNIVSVQEIMVGPASVYLTKEVVDAIPLRTLLRLRQENLEPFTKKELVHLIWQVCEALRWVHMLGVAGNLKPENLLIDEERLRVDDPWFLVGRQDMPPEHGTFPLAGHYLAPEQLAEPAGERRESDIYALALIIGEVLVGKPVRPGVALSDQGPFFSPELDEVFLQATARDPSGRFPSVPMFWDAIRAVFRVPAEEFEGTRTPIGLIPASVAQAWRREPASQAASSAPEPAPAVPSGRPPAAEPPAPESEDALATVEVSVDELLSRMRGEAAPPVAPEPVVPEVLEVSAVEVVPSAETLAPPVPGEAVEVLVAEVEPFEVEPEPVDAVVEAEILLEVEPPAAAPPPAPEPEQYEATLQELRIPEEMAAEASEGIILEDLRAPAPSPAGPTGTLLMERPPELLEIFGAPEEVQEFQRVIEETREFITAEPGMTAPELPPEVAAEAERLRGEAPERQAPDAAMLASEALPVEDLIEDVEIIEDGEIIETGELEAEVAPRAAPAAPAAISLPPAAGTATDSEYQTLRHAAEDDELDEVLSSVGTEAVSADEEELVLVAGASPPPPSRRTTEVMPAATAPATRTPAAPGRPAAVPPEKRSSAGLWGFLAILVIAAGVGVALNWERMPWNRPAQPQKAAKEPGAAPDTGSREGERKGAAATAAGADAAKGPAAGEKASREAGEKARKQAGEKARKQAEADALAKADLEKKEEALREKLKAERAAAEERAATLRAATSKDLEALALQVDTELKALEEVARGIPAEEADRQAPVSALVREGGELAASLAEARRQASDGELGLQALEALAAGLPGTRAKVEDFHGRSGTLTETVRGALQLPREREALLAFLGERATLDEWAGAVDGLLAKSLEGLDAGKEEEKARLDQVQGVRDALAAERKAFAEARAAVEALADPAALQTTAEGARQSAQALETRIQTLREELWKVRADRVATLMERLSELPAGLDGKIAWWKSSGAPDAGREQEALEKERPVIGTRSRDLSAQASREVPQDPAGWVAHVAAMDELLAGTDGDVRRISGLLRREPVNEETKALTELDRQLGEMLGKARQRMNRLEARAREWKQAGNAKRAAEIGEMVKELAGTRDAIQDVRKLVKKGDLAGSRSAFDPIAAQLTSGLERTEPVLAEKVVKADDGGGPAPVDAAAGPGGGNTEAALKALNCPGGMKKMIYQNPEAKKNKGLPSHLGYCIDYYEFPGKGSAPQANVSHAAARAACASQGKRLCTNDEWRRGCGPKYSYGKDYDSERCNTVDAEGMERPILPAGSKAGCRSPYGLYDMIGNVAEWTEEGTVNGGDSFKTADDATCWRSAKRFGASANVGFRCCSDLK